MPTERLSPRLLGSWMDWFTFSRRRRCHRSGYARVPCICNRSLGMMHDPCTLHSGCLVGAAERVSRRLSPRLSPNSSRSVLHTPSVGCCGSANISNQQHQRPCPSAFLPSNSPAISGFEHLPNCQWHHSLIARQCEGRTVRKVLSYPDTSLSESERE